MSAITVNDDIVHYEKLGRGRPVILLHGWIGSWRYWIPLMRQLQLRYAVYAIDLFGFGDSAKNPRQYTIDHQVNLLNQFMSDLNIPKAAFIGHGLGAQVLLRYAQQQEAMNQDRVARLLLTGAPLFDIRNLAKRVPPKTQVPLSVPDPRNPYAGYEEKSASSKPNLPRLESHDDESHNAVTVMRRPAGLDMALGRATPNDGADLTVPNANNETIRNPANMIDRDALQRAALEQGNAIMQSDGDFDTPVAVRSLNSPRPSTGKNALRTILSSGSEALLAKCFKRTESEYEKLEVVVAQMDDTVLEQSSYDFDAGETLDIIRQLKTPTVVVHGEDDPIIKTPSDTVWNYITAENSDTTLPIPIPNVRHFPMLEHEPFIRLVGSFLETPDISKLEIQHRWRRRSR